MEWDWSEFICDGFNYETCRTSPHAITRFRRGDRFSGSFDSSVIGAGRLVTDHGCLR